MTGLHKQDSEKGLISECADYTQDIAKEHLLTGLIMLFAVGTDRRHTVGRTNHRARQLHGTPPGGQPAATGSSREASHTLHPPASF